jgi:hypothetical protein
MKCLSDNVPHFNICASFGEQDLAKMPVGIRGKPRRIA